MENVVLVKEIGFKEVEDVEKQKAQKITNILLIIIQVGITFILMESIYMIFAVLDSDFGLDGIVGLFLFQPILGAIVSLCSILVCFAIGLPLRLNKIIKRWWIDNFYISLIGILCGVTLLFASTLPQFLEAVTAEIDGEEVAKSISNGLFLTSGWFLTTFMALHLFPPAFIIRKSESVLLFFFKMRNSRLV